MLLVGSMARGWSNPKSDYDFYLITTLPRVGTSGGVYRLPLDPPEVRTESFYSDGKRWEVTYWTADQARQMTEKVSWTSFESDVVAGQVLHWREEIFLERVSTGVALTGGEWLPQHREAVEASAFRSLMVTRSLSAADDSVEDALGQVEAGDLHSALLSARKALGHSVDALLEWHGEFGSHSPKWRPNRFRAAAPSILSFEDYWDLETMRTYDPVSPGRWITQVLTLCQDISMKVEV